MDKPKNRQSSSANWDWIEKNKTYAKKLFKEKHMVHDNPETKKRVIITRSDTHVMFTGKGFRTVATPVGYNMEPEKFIQKINGARHHYFTTLNGGENERL